MHADIVDMPNECHQNLVDSSFLMSRFAWIHLAGGQTMSGSVLGDCKYMEAK